MLPPELKAQIFKLPPRDRLALISIIVESLQDTQDTIVTQPDRSSAIQRMRGLLKTEQPAPTDEEVAVMLEEKRAEQNNGA